MESLMELVAASFARHGVECLNAHVATAVLGRTGERSSSADPPFDSNQAALPQEPALQSALSDQSYRKTLQGDPAP
jgi:hypothetical protein